MAGLTVLSVAYPLASVGEDAIGGAEQVLAALDAALVAAGHRSIVIACAGSRVAGELVAIAAPDAAVTRESWIAAHQACRAAIHEVLARERVDLVHMHGIDFHAYLPPPGRVVLATLHLPPAWYPREVFAPARPDTYLQCVSRTQHAQCPPGAPLLDPIENGVDLEALRPGAAHGDHVVVLGRICAEKAPHLALDAATRAGVALVLAGKVFGFPEHQRYHAEQVVPRLVAPHRFIGPVSGDHKRRLLAGARCVIVPSQVDETSSLVAMEALACGTPVIAYRRGALVELVEHGVTGWLVDDVEALGRAIADARRLDRARCRALAEARCSRARMVERTLRRYLELAARPPRARRAGVRVDPLDLDGLMRIEREWSELWDRCPDATVFQRPEWCLPWCRFLMQGTVRALAARRDGRLEVLVPLFGWRDAGAEVLSLIGAGVSDYQDLLGAPAAPEAVRAVTAALADLAWDRLELSELRTGSPLLGLPLPGVDTRTEQQPCPALVLRRDAPLDAVAPGTRREIAYQRRRAARELGIETVRLDPTELIDALVVLHQARWASRGEPGAIDAHRRRFLEAAIARLATRELVLGIGVRLGGALAAVVLGLVDREVVRYYLGGFDPAYHRRSPGTLAIAAAIEEAATIGARSVDFLRGAEPYKYRFGATDRVWLHRRVLRRMSAGR